MLRVLDAVAEVSDVLMANATARDRIALAAHASSELVERVLTECERAKITPGEFRIHIVVKEAKCQTIST